MKRMVLFLILALSVLAAGCSQGTAPPPQSLNSSKTRAAEPAPPASESTAPRIPPYHASAETAQPLPTPRPASRYKDFPVIEKAYTVAAEIPEILAQQPCYCYCDRSAGHGSLADCWASDHGAG